MSLQEKRGVPKPWPCKRRGVSTRALAHHRFDRRCKQSTGPPHGLPTPQLTTPCHTDLARCGGHALAFTRGRGVGYPSPGFLIVLIGCMQAKPRKPARLHHHTLPTSLTTPCPRRHCGGVQCPAFARTEAGCGPALDTALRQSIAWLEERGRLASTAVSRL